MNGNYDPDANFAVPACMTWDLPTEGMTMAQWQVGRCAGCGTDRSPLVLDHDHDTGMERGLLCRSCNTTEGVSRAPRWRRWRSGWNPATLLGIEERYEGWGTALEEYQRRTEPTEDELRTAINRL